MLLIDSNKYITDVSNSIVVDYLNDMKIKNANKTLEYNVRKYLTLIVIKKCIGTYFDINPTTLIIPSDIDNIIRTYYIPNDKLEDSILDSIMDLNITQDVFIDVVISNRMLILVMEKL